MGAYLTKPITKKISSDKVGKNVAFGASSMQGWRVSQEDAHNCCIEFDKDVSLFAVYDGHGGHEVATYCASNLPKFIKETEAYKKGDIRQALIDAFLGFDATLAQPEVITILKELANPSVPDCDEDKCNDTDEEENISDLHLEAAMPVDQVIASYKSEIWNLQAKHLENEKSNKRSCPYLIVRKGKDKASCSSSGAGCSSSSSAWNTNEADVSSSSQPCGSSMSVTMKKKESSRSNEAEQVLDSTTSNGNMHASVPVVSTADMETAKSADMPDSSEDVKEKVSSPGKSTCSATVTNEVELNGAKSRRIEGADSSKGGGDNVSSSSCTPVENGDAGQQERISSSGRRRVQSSELYQSFLKRKDDELEGDDDDDDDEENDETFDGALESDEDDTEDVDEDESDEDEDKEDEDEEEDEDDDEEEDEEESILNLEEPGADSGCTAVVAILKGNELYVANAGDSRCVLCRDGQALELSLDHKPEDEPEMERIIKAGGKVSLDGRVNGGLNLSRALGDHSYKKNTVLLPQEQMISALPDVRHITIEPERDEFMILACDGIWNFMSSQSVVQFIKTRLTEEYDNISKICEALFDHCLAPDTFGDGTGCDNMTAVIVRFKPPSSNSTNATVAEVCVKDKRLSSPSPNKDSNDCSTEENRMQPCKRLKTETLIK